MMKLKHKASQYLSLSSCNKLMSLYKSQSYVANHCEFKLGYIFRKGIFFFSQPRRLIFTSKRDGTTCYLAQFSLLDAIPKLFPIIILLFVDRETKTKCYLTLSLMFQSS